MRSSVVSTRCGEAATRSECDEGVLQPGLLHPQVLFLDDPTRGIDVGAKQDIYRLIDELAAEGKAIILVSSELPELLRCCDRILVLNEGRVTAHYDAGNATQEKIMSAATSAEVRT